MTLNKRKKINNWKEELRSYWQGKEVPTLQGVEGFISQAIDKAVEEEKKELREKIEKMRANTWTKYDAEKEWSEGIGYNQAISDILKEL